MRYVDTSTGEIIELMPYPPKVAQSARVARTQPVRKTSKFPLSAVLGKVMQELGPFLVMGLLACVLIAWGH